MMKFSVTYRDNVPGENMTRRNFNDYLKQSYHEMGYHWWRFYRPLHFKRQGARKYKYRKRSGEGKAHGSREFRRSYTGFKKRKFGHTISLVYTGDSERASKSGRIRATRKAVRVSMPTNTLNRRGKSNIDMAGELRTIPADEADTLVRVFNSNINFKLANHQGGTVKK